MGRFYTVFVFIFGAFLSFAQDGTDVPKLRCISTLGQVSSVENNRSRNFKNSFPNPLSSALELPRHGKLFLDVLKHKTSRYYLVEGNGKANSLVMFVEDKLVSIQKNIPGYNVYRIPNRLHALMMLINKDSNFKDSVQSLVPLYDYLLLMNALKKEIQSMPNPKSGILFGFRHGPVDDLVTAIEKQTEFVLANPGKEVPSLVSFIPEKNQSPIHEEYFNTAFAILQKLGSRLVKVSTEPQLPQHPPFSFWNNAPHPGLEFTADEYQTEPLTPIFQNTAFAHAIKAFLDLNRKSPDETLADLFTSETLSALDVSTFRTETRKLAKVLKSKTDADPNHPLRRIISNALPKLAYLDRIIELIPEHLFATQPSRSVHNGPLTVGASLSHLLFDLRNDWLNFEKRENKGILGLIHQFEAGTQEYMRLLLQATEEQITRENPELVPIIPVEAAKVETKAPAETERVTNSAVIDLRAEDPIDIAKLNLIAINQYGDTLINAERELTAAASALSAKLRSDDTSKLNLGEIDEQLTILDELLKNTEHLISILEESLSKIEGSKKELGKPTGKEGAKSRNSMAIKVLAQKEEALKTSLGLSQDSFALAEEWFLKLSEIRGKSSSQTSTNPATNTPVRMKPKE